MVALLWSTAGGGGRADCGGGVPDDAGLAVPLEGDREVYEAAATCKFDFLTDAGDSRRGRL